MPSSFTNWLKNWKTNSIGARRKQARSAARTIRSTRLHLEPLEDRLTPATFTVLSTLDDGSVGSLRWAVEQANAAAGADTIDFDTAVFATPQTITLTSGRLWLARATTITGPGANLLSISGNHASQ